VVIAIRIGEANYNKLLKIRETQFHMVPFLSWTGVLFHLLLAGVEDLPASPHEPTRFSRDGLKDNLILTPALDRRALPDADQASFSRYQ
jgi:hypothetical protein